MWGDTKAHTFHMVINMLYLISTQQVMKIDTYITNTYKWSYNFYSQISFPQPEAIGQKKKEKISSKIGQDKKTTLIFVFTQALTATVKIDSWSRDWNKNLTLSWLWSMDWFLYDRALRHESVKEGIVFHHK